MEELLFKNRTELSKQNYMILLKFHEQRNSWKYWAYTAFFSIVFLSYMIIQIINHSFIIAVLIFIVVCNNVIKNEIKDIKNLVIFGYTKRKIKSIIFIKLFSITFIGFFLGIIISQLFLYLIADILKIKIYRNIIREIIINLIIIIIPIFIIKTRTLNKKFFK